VTHVAVFIDYRNCFHRARSVFESTPFPRATDGQFWPSELAQLLVDKGSADEHRVLAFAGVYTGRPDPRKDPITAGAHNRQCAAWTAKSPTLVLKTRALRYPPFRPVSEAEEKGIDVQLAIDAMLMGAREELDTAVIASADTDMLPVVEGLLALGKSVEVIAWAGLSQKLELPGQIVPVRWIGQHDWETIADRTHYSPRPGG
jgi:uncharacterized LabA/DUF88 family protein